MIEGFDVSKYQLPAAFDWPALQARGVRFMVARASYGGSLADKHFERFAERIRENGLAFGAYHFYRQIHSVEDQLRIFDRQLEKVGGLQPGDMFPVLDMEDNRTYDGYPIASTFSEGCRRIAEAWRDRYGGCILYYSSYFPEYLKKKDAWRQEEGYYHWLADYGTRAKPTPPGEPRTPYTNTWHLHQPFPRKVPEYADGSAEVDYDVANPAHPFEQLLITSPSCVSDEAEQCECDTSARPGGALPDDDTVDAALRLVEEGIEYVRKGASLLKA